MGIINHEQPFDDTYSQEIIAKARELSPELDEYVVTQQYLVDTQEENLSPMWLRNRLLCKLVEQLNASGIFINLDTDSAIDQPVFIDAILTLHAKFCEDRFTKLLKAHRELTDDVTQLIEDDCIEAIVNCCTRDMPLDEGWESISRLLEDRPCIIRSTEEFTDLIKNAIEASDKLGEPDMVAQSDMDKLLGYNSFLSERKSAITKITRIIYAANDLGEMDQSRQEIVDQIMRGFERELSRPSVIRDYLGSEVDVKQFVETRRQIYASRWNHCMEYWVTTANHGAVITELEMAKLVATLYIDAPDRDHARVHVVSVFENSADMLGDRYEKFRDMIDKALGNLVIVEKGLIDGTK